MWLCIINFEIRWMDLVGVRGLAFRSHPLLRYYRILSGWWVADKAARP